jgi:hypothetical protein
MPAHSSSPAPDRSANSPVADVLYPCVGIASVTSPTAAARIAVAASLRTSSRARGSDPREVRWPRRRARRQGAAVSAARPRKQLPAFRPRGGVAHRDARGDRDLRHEDAGDQPAPLPVPWCMLARIRDLPHYPAVTRARSRRAASSCRRTAAAAAGRGAREARPPTPGSVHVRSLRAPGPSRVLGNVAHRLASIPRQAPRQPSTGEWRTESPRVGETPPARPASSMDAAGWPGADMGG